MVYQFILARVRYQVFNKLHHKNKYFDVNLLKQALSCSHKSYLLLFFLQTLHFFNSSTKKDSNHKEDDVAMHPLNTIQTARLPQENDAKPAFHIDVISTIPSFHIEKLAFV